MKLNSRDFKIPIHAKMTDPMEPISAESIKQNQKKLLDFIDQARSKLNIIKDEIYSLLDAGYQNSQGLDIGRSGSPMFNDLVSGFLEKAFTVQVFGYKPRLISTGPKLNFSLLEKKQLYILKNAQGNYQILAYKDNEWLIENIDRSTIDFKWGSETAFISPTHKLFHTFRRLQPNEEGLENRVQEYINYGIWFNQTMDKNKKPTDDQKFLHYTGEFINAVNNVLSLINRIEYLISIGKCEQAGGILPRLNSNLQILNTVSKQSNLVSLVDEGRIQSTISWILDFLTTFINYCRNITKTQAEVNQDRFFKLKYSSLGVAPMPEEKKNLANV